MTVRIQHFSFTGDGRSSGTAPSGSTLGTPEELAVKILGNIVALLVNAGWVSVIKTYTQTDCSSYNIDIPGTSQTIQIYMQSDPDQFVVEAPLTFETDLGTTKLFICYEYGTAKNPTGITSHFGSNESWNFISDVSSRSHAKGLTFLYVPPTCADTDKFRPVSFVTTTSSGTAYYSIPYVNAASDYTFMIFTEEDTVGIILRNHNWSHTRYKSIFMGPILNTLVDDLDKSATYEYKKYMILSPTHPDDCATNEGAGMTAANSYKMMGSPYSFFKTYSVYPYTQFFDYQGHLQVTNDKMSNNYNLGYGRSIFESNSSILGAMNFNSSSNLIASKILIGAYLQSFSGGAFQNNTYVSPNKYLKGILNDSYFISIGSHFIGSDSTSGLDPISIGTTFNNKSYVYLGCGVCMGWDPDCGKEFLDVSQNTMSTPVIVETT